MAFLIKACDTFHETIQQGVVPNVVMYSFIIDELCKVGAMDKEEQVLQQIFDDGVRPNTVTCLIHGYSTSGQSKDFVRLLKEMRSCYTKRCYLQLSHDLPLRASKSQRSCRKFSFHGFEGPKTYCLLILYYAPWVSYTRIPC